MNTVDPHPERTPTSPQREAKRGLLSAGFQGLLFTQLLTATNDNIFRWLVIGIGKQYVTPDNVRHVLMAGSVFIAFGLLRFERKISFCEF